MDIQSESLAYWYLRLNGFFTIQGFVVHPYTGSNQKTDIDVFGVRFPFRQELVSTYGQTPMEDDSLFSRIKIPLVVLVEVALRKCKINKTWKDLDNIKLFLSASGVFRPEIRDKIAVEIKKSKFYEDSSYYFTYLCIGASKDTEMQCRNPRLIQITFDEIKRFIFNRFIQYEDQKANHQQWDQDGRNLYKTVTDHRSSVEDFITNVNVIETP
jgi:hypothetical protein